MSLYRHAAALHVHDATLYAYGVGGRDGTSTTTARSRPKPHGQTLQAAKNDHAGAQIELLRRHRQLQRFHGAHYFSDRALHLLAREHCTETEVNTRAKGQVLARVGSIQVEFVGLREALRVAI